MRIDTQQLYESMATLKRLKMERDDELMDLADSLDHYEAVILEREQETFAALEACVKAGVEEKYLRILARETGLTSAIKHLLSGR